MSPQNLPALAPLYLVREFDVEMIRAMNEPWR
jgi:hypothetical protein